MNKKPRQNALLKIIDNMSIYSQAELARALAENGFKVTQASVSRDLDELGIGKLNGKYVRPAKEANEAGVEPVVFDIAGDNLIVGRCSPGLASALTVRIDRTAIPGIVGTIAGDDNIFVAVRDVDAQRSVLERLGTLFD